MKAVIMAAGESTRTFPLTVTRPKALLPIANKTILERQLDSLVGIVDGVVLIVGYRHEMIRERMGDRYAGIGIEYVVQQERKGTGHAVLQCKDLIAEPFLAMNGDDLWEPADLAAVAAEEQAALAKVVDDPRLYGIYEVDRNDCVVRLVEKPKEVFSNLANIGVYKFTPEVFDVLEHTPPSERGEIEITSAIQTLAERGCFKVVRAQGYWLAIGYPWHLLDANQFILENHLHVESYGTVSPLADLNGVVSIGQGTVIKAGAVIEGPVLIGERCEVGPNCYLRPGTTLGNGCKVGQGSEVKNSILMDGAKVPHLSYVGDSVLGEGVNLGCGTVVANFRHDGKTHRSEYKGELVDTGRRKFGAIIGDHVHTGIHTSIYPGRKLWPHTNTLPGEIVRGDKRD
ncbi:MAG: NTP transferase domain-containing protein [Candidatus Hydrogenedens sp.]|nr:NTP transferase domain-containing protein [Candidatus Hydrogenedens sp.]